MPVYKLYYFNSRGRAEPARLCFAAGGVKYEDVRFTGEEWQQKKQGMFRLYSGDDLLPCRSGAEPLLF